MVRLILVAAFVAIVAIGALVMLGLLQGLTRQSEGKDDTLIPAKFQRVTYVLLVILMIGVTSGMIGGL